METTTIKKSGGYNVIRKHGVGYVLRELDREHSGFSNPNFIGSGMALRGVLKAGETISQFVKRDTLKTLRPIEKPN